MSESVMVSAPGKLMLFGEHAVVYGKPSIVTAVNQRLFLKAEMIENHELLLRAPGVGVADYRKSFLMLGQGEVLPGARFVEIALRNFIRLHAVTTGVKIEITSEFEATIGFGSSSAVTVCTITALAQLFGHQLTERQIFDLSYKTVLDIQGVGSGVDVAAAIYGGTLYYVAPGKVIEPIKIEPFPLVIGYTGIKADTAAMINMVSRRKDENPQLYETIFAAIEKIVEEAKQALMENDLVHLGKLMNDNQAMLEQMGVSSPQLDVLIAAARGAAAYGAKLSGAGAGDCMIAVASQEKKKEVEAAIVDAGGQMVPLEINARGLTRELV